MLSDVSSGLQTSDRNVMRKYIRKALYLFLFVMDVCLLLTSCIALVSLYLFGFKTNLSLFLV